MKQTHIHRQFAALAASLIPLTLGTIASGTAWADSLMIPKGTVVPVALIQDVSSASAKAGDKVKAVYTGDEEGGFPTGTVFVGTVTEASPKTSSASGKIKLAFKEAILPDKKTVPIDGIPVGATPTAEQEKKKKRGSAGKGAAGGAAVGMAVAGNNTTGAIVGGVVGGAAGHAKSSKPTEAEIKKGASFGIQLQAAAKVPQAAASHTAAETKTTAPK
jgi:hypothetical protein